MESSDVVRALSALAQESRLAVFRSLVRIGPEGVPAGDLARALNIAPNTLSAQLSVLAHAGLIRSRRDGRSVIYTADYAAMSDVILHLLAECCEGRPEVCAPVAALAASCAPAQRSAPRRSCR